MIIFANPRLRFLAHLIDVALLSLVTYIMVILLPFYEYNRAIIFKEVTYLILSILYYVYFTSSDWQATIGKRFLKMKVVNQNMKKLSLKESLKRYIGYYFCYVSAGLGFFMIFTNNKRQSLQDKFANTYVIIDGEKNHD